MNRTELALAAVEGISNTELAERGAEGYKKMIERKRAYAYAARTFAAENQMLRSKIESLMKELAEARAAAETAAIMATLDAPVTDTSEASAMLQSIFKGQAH